jgi:hypothetical protein
VRDGLLGTDVPPFEVTLDATLNRYFLEATGEEQELFVAEKAVPPTSLFGPARPGYPDPLELMGTSYDKAVMGSASYEIARLPLVGETLRCTGRVSDVTTKEGKGGSTMNFITLENTFRDQAGEPVVVERLTFIERG